MESIRYDQGIQWDGGLAVFVHMSVQPAKSLIEPSSVSNIRTESTPVWQGATNLVPPLC